MIPPNDYKDFMRCWQWLLAICILALFIGSLTSCGSTRCIEAPTTVYQRDTINESKVLRDSVIIRDSVYVSGDKEYRERLVRSVSLRTDTLYIERTDSVRVLVPYPVSTKEQAKWYDTAFKRIGQAVCIAGLLWLIFLYIKRRR